MPKRPQGGKFLERISNFVASEVTEAVIVKLSANPPPYVGGYT
jgi:hypothetical protein